MTTLAQWVGKIASRDLGSLSACRHRAGWALRSETGDTYWLRVPHGDDEAFRKLPLLGRWSTDNDGTMIREGKRVPEALLPADGWQPLATMLPIAMPPRGAPGMPPAAVHFQLEKDDTERPATSLLCRGSDLLAWAGSAFAPRLECLQFACCEDGRTIVVGTPLPPVPGSGLYRIGRLWLPCGWCLPDCVWPELLEEVLGLGRNRMCLLQADGSHEEMDAENLVPASRAALRSSIPA